MKYTIIKLGLHDLQNTLLKANLLVIMFPQISVSSLARHIKHSKVETSKINLQNKINSMSGKDKREKKNIKCTLFECQCI